MLEETSLSSKQQQRNKPPRTSNSMPCVLSKAETAIDRKKNRQTRLFDLRRNAEVAFSNFKYRVLM